MLFLGADCSRHSIHCVLVEAGGRVVQRTRSRRQGTLEADLASALAPCLEAASGPFEAAVAAEGCGQLALPEGAASLWQCRPEEALLCGALGCRPGVVITSATTARALGIDRGLKPRQLEQDGGSAGWLAEQGLASRAQSPRLAQAAARLYGSKEPEGVARLAFCREVLELATFPGPDPICRALVLKAARSLCDLTRYLVPRVQTLERATWAGVGMNEPLLEAYFQELQQHLPGLPWRQPRFTPEVGCALLAQAGYDERQRRDDQAASSRKVGPDVWRHVFRNRKPFPEYE
ncbi:MAG: hypothetical protein KC910_13980 [Candidatus Eremiobacteraeota bacterium]|nr:hypothetical protein [Candidatus Eremiobacteraeota bacterium]